MITGHCKDCRHWQRDEPDRYEMGTHPCALTHTRYDSGAHPDSLAKAHDAEGYRAWPETAPNFSCVQFQPQE